MTVFDIITMGERLVIVVCMTGEPRNIRVLWGLEKLPRSFFQILHWDGKVVEFL